MKPGDIVVTLNNKKMTVDSVLSKEGKVFVVLDNGEKKFLKLYDTSFSFDSGDSAFFRWICGAPDAAFVWPETRLKDNTYGYVYGSHQRDYISMSTLLGDVERLKSFNLHSIICACIKIVDAYRNAYRNMDTCINIEDHDIFINPKTGDVLINGFEKMAIPVDKIMVKHNFKAPEMVGMDNSICNSLDEKERRNADLFAVSVIVFELCFLCHPFEGRKTLKNPCVTPQTEKEIYGKEAVFVFDPIDDSNRPYFNLNYLEERWSSFPKYARDFFIQAFSKEAIQKPENRMHFHEWRELFVRLRNDIIQCKSCGSLIFFNNKSPICSSCGQPTGVEYLIEKTKDSFPAAKGKKVISYTDLSLSVYGEIVSAKNDPNILGIKNLTNSNWIAGINGNSIKQFSKNEIVPIKEGVEIRTGRGWIKVKKLNREYLEDGYSKRKALEVELAPYQMIPLIIVVDTSDEMSIVGNDKLKDALIESIGTLNEAAESNNYRLGTTILVYSDDPLWLPVNGFSLIDSVQVNEFDFDGRPNLGKALKSMNEMMTRAKLFSKRAGIMYTRPIVLFFISGVIEDGFEEELKRLKDNDWFMSSTKIALVADSSFDVNIMNMITGNIDAILNLNDIDLLKKYILPPLD